MLACIITHRSILMTWLEKRPWSDPLPELEWKVTACTVSSLLKAEG